MNTIIKTLKKYPEKDVFHVAKKLKLEPFQVSLAQHELLISIRKPSKK